VKLLLTNKAGVNAKTNKGETPVQMAVAQKHKDVADLLRQHGGHE
jgi:ankyrin repeat protein